MTPAARLSAGIEILDRILLGEATQKTLTNWARGNRYAGSGDRAAIRDMVYDCLRCRASFAVLGGSLTGRGLVLGAVKSSGDDASTLFTGEKYAPAALTEDEVGHLASTPELSAEDSLDCPAWLVEPMKATLGDGFEEVMSAFQTRAPVFLRVNTARADVDKATAVLGEDAIEVSPHPLAVTALKVTANARRITNNRAYHDGLVEIQDVASQAVVEALQLPSAGRVLDYCAGGGGKTLAIAGLSGRDLALFAHDTAPERMRDLTLRANRAGAKVTIVAGEDVAAEAPYDLVLCDVPCSGSGAWRRNPEAKWSLDEEKLKHYCAVQGEILRKAAKLTAKGGKLTYVTCSLLDSENQQQVTEFMSENDGWTLVEERQFTPLDGGDGLYLATLTKN